MMESAPKRDIYHIYELEAHSLSVGKDDVFWRNVFQIGGTFIFMTFVVFFMINFRFIASQIADWYGAREHRMAADLSSGLSVPSQAQKYLISEVDSDNDGINNELESVLGTDSSNADSDEDGRNDFQEISNGNNPLGDGLLKAELDFSDEKILSIVWENKTENISEEVVLRRDEERLVFNNTFIVPYEYIKDQDSKLNISVLVYLSNGKKIRSVYREKTREISSSSLENSRSQYGVQLVSGWPEGTDWQRLIVNTELIKMELDN